MTRRHSLYRRFGKRLLDLGVTVVLAPFLLLLGLAAAVLVYFDLGRPVLFRQRRIGFGARPFLLMKFRTMREERNPRGQPAPDSERLSTLGALLRRSSLDEIPEFLSVLKGEMSLVGPRPLLPEYLEHYTVRQARRHEVLPGLTGLAQVLGRNDTTWEARLENDVRYVDSLSFVLDLSILSRTCWVMLTGRGVSAPGHATMPRFDDQHQRDETDPRDENNDR